MLGAAAKSELALKSRKEAMQKEKDKWISRLISIGGSRCMRREQDGRNTESMIFNSRGWRNSHVMDSVRPWL